MPGIGPTSTEMNALVLKEYGSAETLSFSKLPKPSPTSTQLLVKVKAAGVNPIDALLRAGYLAKMIPLQSFPAAVLGIDFAGEVVAVGDAVKDYAVGNYVYGKFGAINTGKGAYCEYITVDEEKDAISLKPLQLSFAEAAGVGTVAITAWEGVHTYNKIDKGQHILIIGGTSAVGQYAIQLASLAGAHVTTICSAANFPLVKQHGALVVIDYKSRNWKKELLDLPYSFDAIFDTVGGDYYDTCIHKLKSDASGTYASTVFPTKGKYIAGLPVQHLKNHIHPLFVEKSLKPLKITSYKLEEGADAHKAIESHRTVGKIVLIP